MSNPLHAYATDNGDFDLTSAATIFSESNAGSVPRWVTLDITVGDGTKNLAASADTVLTFQLSNGGVLGDALTRTIPTSQTRARLQTDPIMWVNGETLALTCLSDQAGDTDVDVTVVARDVAPLQPATSGRTAAIDASGIADAQVKGIDADAITVTAIANDAITDAKVASDVTIASVTGSVGSVTGNVGGNVVGSVGSISGVTFPANFSDLAIAATTGYVDLGFIKGVDAVTQLGSTCATASSVALNTFGWAGITVGDVSDKTGFSLAADQSGVTIGTVNAMAGTIQTLDALDTAQDSQHATTQSTLATIGGYLDTEIAAILEDTGTTIPGLIDIITSNGVTLATAQPNYAPAKAGDEMDLVDAPNATAVSAIQSGLATLAKLLNYVRLLARKDAAVNTDLATELGEINANTGTGTGTYSNNDALESIRDNASGLDAAGTRAALGLGSANLDTQLGNIQTGVDGISVSASPTLLQTTTIATLASQTSFTLTAGSADDDAYNNMIAIIVDQSTSTQKTVVNISDYIGSTRTVTLSESPKFTIATGDLVYVVAASKTTLTDDVINSLSGTLVRFVKPAWTGQGWDAPFIKGDSYLGGLAPTITISNWVGDQLISAASSIKLSGTRTVSGTTTTFAWTLNPADVTVSGGTTTIPVELSANDTDVTAGEYTADLRATWTSPAETVSLIQPTFKLVIKEPAGTF